MSEDNPTVGSHSATANTNDKQRRLIITRRAHRAQMTRLLHKGENIIENQEHLNNTDILEGLVDSMHTKVKLLSDLDSEILELVAEDELEDAIIDADEYLEQVNIRVRAVKSECKINSTNNSNNNSIHSTVSTASNHNHSSRRINLPKLVLPRFSGDLLQWITFKEAFNAAVADDDNLDEIQKFQYLQSQLDGDAARTIAGLPLTNANYAEAMSLLEKRFGQPHKIISSYMKALLELPKPVDTISSLQDFYDKSETYIRSLRSLGKTEDAYGDLLVPIIFEKLSNRFRTQISREHGDVAWTLSELRDAIYHEIQASQAGDFSDHLETTTTTASLFLTQQRQGNRYQEKPKVSVQTFKCTYCKGNHYSSDCEKVSDIAKRREIAKRDRLCFNCLRPHHNSNDCQARGRCRVCKNKHHTSLCYKHDSVKSENSGKSDNSWRKDKSDSKITVTTTRINKSDGPVLLKTASTKLWCGNKAVNVNILFDEGAQRTFVTEKVVHLLSYDSTKTEDISISTFGGDDSKLQKVNVADIKIETKCGPVDLCALVVPKISTPVKNLVSATVMKHDYLKKLTLADHLYMEADTFEIDLLVGADYYWSIVGDKTVRGSGPTAVESKLGYLLSGPSGIDINAMNTMICKVMVSSEDIESKITDYWNLETIGIKDNEQNTCEFEEYSDKHLTQRDGKYIADLPWKYDHPPLPSNYAISERRTRSMVKRLSPDIRQAYNNIIMEQLQRGFIELVSNDNTSVGHYIPHHPVYKDSITTPIRIVYDCSCKQANNPSLNDCLDVGPCLTKNLVEILLRFRLHPVAFVSDIEKAFLNIQLQENDRDYTKFLWLTNPDDPNSDFTTYRFKAVLFGSVSSPFILNAVVKKHLEYEPNAITKDMLDNLYVDNLVSGVSTLPNAVEYYEHSVDVMKQGGFKLRSWSTNNETLRDKICESKLHEADAVVKVLGLMWNTNTDELLYNPKVSQEESKVYTKREVIRITSSLYDPLGALSPVHVKAKTFIQKLWKLNLEWDETLTPELVEEWIQIKLCLDHSRNIVIKRPYFSNGIADLDNCELHVFADASLKAYGAVVYIVHNNESQFVMAKTRVKPLKETTLPRLELLASFVAAHLLRFVCKALHQVQFNKTVLWSDSQIVLHWIHSNKKLPIFVQNRVKFIRDTLFTDIKYCQTNDNPADLLTRGIKNSELEQSKLWWNGPAWLIDGDWPICDAFDNKILTCQLEDSVNESNISDTTTPIDNSLPKMIDIKRYSSLGKLLRVTAYVLRFINKLKKEKTITNSDYITVHELKMAENIWIKQIQTDVYSNEMMEIEKKCKKQNSLVTQLKLFKDDAGVIRCKGRLENAELRYDAKYPILLPRQHYFTELIVKHSHSVVIHAGVNTTVTFIRNRFWIPKIRQVVKRIIRSCVTCIKVIGKPFRSPEIPPLPKCRLQEGDPFTVTGVDFTGALFYKTNDGSNKTMKAYICLFTCAVTRAVHIEVVADMSTWTFLQAFRRFAARRSLPNHMISDNGSTFLAGAEEISKVCKDSKVHNYLTSRNITWHFIPKRAPWFGGFYERLIGITKTTLKKTLGKKLLSLNELVTLVTEVETIINERPMTYMASDVHEPQPLTPSMLLNGRSLMIMPHSYATEEDLTDPDFGNNDRLFHQRSLHLDVIFKQLWSRWRNEYLPSLRETHIHNMKGHAGLSENKIKVGDVVLVHEDSHKRIQWPLAVVTKLKTGNDNLVRSAEIKMKNGISNRPITKLYPLEVSCSPDDVSPVLEQSRDILRINSDTSKSCYSPDDVSPVIEEQSRDIPNSDTSNTHTSRYGRVLKKNPKYI